MFSLEGRKIPRKLRFIIPLICVYPVQTPLLMSQITTGTFLYKLEPIVTLQTD